MAEWFVGPVMEKLIDTCFDYLIERASCQTGMEEELQRLRDIHPRIQAVVSAYSQAHIRDENGALNKWMWQLRDAIDEADDLFDEFEYMKLKEHLASNMEQTKVRPSFTGFLSRKFRKVASFGDIKKIDPKLERLEKVVQKLDKVSAGVGTFLNLLESKKQEQRELQLELHKTRETGSLPKSDLIGRGKDKEYVIQWLRRPSNEEHQISLYKNISLLSIVGHGGMGKTTLLQHLYEDEMINEFDLKMWVCVSNNFDVKRVIADMLESLTKNRPHLESSLDALQKSLQSEVMSKKFLLVLDDIWEEGEDKSKWENALAPLANGSLGSKILITTRMDSVALILAHVIRKKKETWRLEGLEEDECLQLLNTHAFADVENPDDHQKLRYIAGEMVKKLFGSPLATKVMGGVLNSSLDERHWTQVLNSDFRSAESIQNDIFAILKLSYIFLPKYLQTCFSFCCIFPQDHKFDKEDLVRMWIAVGFIQPSIIRGGETLEDVGGRYFDVLVKKSFFDEVATIHYKKHEVGTKHYKKHEVGTIRYKMHDLIHELAQSVSVHECFRDVGDEELLLRIPETIRHLSIKSSNLEVVRKACKFKKLRTLYIAYDNKDDYDNQDFANALIEIFEKVRSIRLLYISSLQMKKIPEEIEYLIHLRYLRLSVSDVNILPRSLSNLYHMQFIKLRPNFRLSNDFFPRDMNNLSNLHYLCSPDYRFPGIGKLKLLQELNEFNVKNENGYRIGELQHMNDLRLLRIRLLEHVRDADEAYNAKLCDKRNLVDLSLYWGHIDSRQKIIDPNLDERVLHNLQPHNSLKKLSIYGYMGVRFAIWMSKAHSISNLEYISLSCCLEVQTLPSFGYLPFLKSLILCDMPKAKWIDNKFHGNAVCCVFPSLDVLRIVRLEALEGWFDTGLASEDDCLFPRLTELFLEDCPILQELSYLPPNLKNLMIKNIGWKTLKFCIISNCILLETLQIVDCPNITSIFLDGEIFRLTVLREVEILNCPKLIPLGGYQEVDTAENCQITLEKLIINDPSVLLIEPLRSITSIRKLQIMNNDELVSFSFETEQWFLQVRASLYELIFSNLHSMQSLPFALTNLSSLENLHVQMAPRLQLLPSIPPSLKNLQLQHLESLQSLPSSLSTISSLKYLHLTKTPLKFLPNLPPSLCKLRLNHLDNLVCLPSSLSSLSSLISLDINDVPHLQELPDLPPSLCKLYLENLKNLDCLPSFLPILSSLKDLFITAVPRLRELPNLPISLCALALNSLDNLDCLPSFLPCLSSLEELEICKIPQVHELPDLPPSLCELGLGFLDNPDCLPSSLPSLTSLQLLCIYMIPKLRELPNLPLSLCVLNLDSLDNLDCLPSCLPSLSSLKELYICKIPQLHKIPDLPPSLCELSLKFLDNLNCLPSSLPSLTCLQLLSIYMVPKLRELPNLPPSLNQLNIKKCHPELVKRYEKF